MCGYLGKVREDPEITIIDRWPGATTLGPKKHMG